VIYDSESQRRRRYLVLPAEQFPTAGREVVWVLGAAAAQWVAGRRFLYPAQRFAQVSYPQRGAAAAGSAPAGREDKPNNGSISANEETSKPIYQTVSNLEEVKDALGEIGIEGMDCQRSGRDLAAKKGPHTEIYRRQ